MRAAFGVSAAQAEANIVTQRRGTKVDIVSQLKEDLEGSYAGVWFDNQVGQFVVPIAASAAKTPFVAQERRASVAEEFAAASLAGHYRTETVDFSHAELAAAQGSLDDALGGLFAGGALRTAIDPTHNAITVSVPESIDPSTLAKIRRIVNTVSVKVEIEKRPDEAFKMRAAACTLRNNVCDRPFRGGQQIWETAAPDPNSEVLGTCTAAFRANGWDGRKYVLTAGHCVKDVYTGAVGWHWMASHTTLGRGSVGTTSQWHWPGKDWAKIDATGNFWDVAPWPTILGLPDWGVHDYPVVGEAKSYVGQTLCHTGAGSDTSCGIVIAENVSAEYDWNGKEKVNGMFEVFGKDLCVGDGDSGGPFFANNIALGILSGGVGNQCYTWVLFSDIMAASAELGVNIAGPGAPEAVTGAPTSIQPNSATISGQVNPRGLSSNYYVEYGQGAYTNLWGPAGAGAGQGFVSVSPTLTGLEPATTYQYRVTANNSLSNAWGQGASFTTPPVPPVVTTEAASNITETSATLRATIDPEGAATTYYFEYGPTRAYGKKSSELAAGQGRNPVSVSGPINELQPKTHYHYRVVAVNAGGTSYGQDRTFTTGLKWIINGSNGSTGKSTTFWFGLPGDTPVSGDWNGDGTVTPGVYDPVTGIWKLRNSNSEGPADVAFQFGGGPFKPVVGDWDGNGTATVGLYEPNAGNWVLRNVNSGTGSNISFQ
ncbi:MAG: trypsin-like serine protease [Actinomycetota bacterium]|nr:trypsin-like serine protease [Actinomycetota bacterium]